MNTTKKGRHGEYTIILRLIEQGFDVYTSLVDDKGIDVVVQNPKGHYLEVQMKSVYSTKDPEWFQVRTTVGDHPETRKRFFMMCLSLDKNIWIFPANIFFNKTYSTSATNKGTVTWDLNLARTRRGNSQSNRALLQQYKNNWDLLLNFEL